MARCACRKGYVFGYVHKLSANKSSVVQYVTDRDPSCLSREPIKGLRRSSPQISPLNKGFTTMSKRQQSDHHTDRHPPAPRLRTASREPHYTAPPTQPSTQPPPQLPQPPVRTLRISDIPLGVTKDDFTIYLEVLLGYDGFILSLVLSESYIIATVTLTKGEPPDLLSCTPGNRIYLEFPGTVFGLVVDCDFLGMTPLYSAEEPTVE